jgi:hypothetical protein
VRERRLLAIVGDDDVCRRPDDDPRHWTCGRTDLSCHRRCTGPL